MANRQQRIDEVLGAGQELIDSGHFATDQIEEWCDRLTESWEHLLEKCTQRRNMLGDAAESQRVRLRIALPSLNSFLKRSSVLQYKRKQEHSEKSCQSNYRLSPKETGHCLISCNVKAIKAIAMK